MSVLIHIHEDDWGMRSLHPIAAWPEAAADIDEAAAAGNRNRAPDGVGWTSVHVIAEPQIDFTSNGLSLEEAARLLAPLMPRVKRFVATSMAGFRTATRDPYGSYEENAWAFGFDAGCFIKLEPEGDLVRRIWFEASTGNTAHLAALRLAILAIDAIAECILIDYWSDSSGRVRDGGFLDRYFAALAGDA